MNPVNSQWRRHDDSSHGFINIVVDVIIAAVIISIIIITAVGFFV